VKIKLEIVTLLIFLLLPVQSYAQNTSREDQRRTCEAVLQGKPALAECNKVFTKDATCCIQYDFKRLAKQCGKMSSVQLALSCFTEIHEVGFWKTDLLPENEPGLGSRFAEQWKKNVVTVCSSEKTNTAALECAVLQKSGIKFVFHEKNAQVGSEATTKDPIFQFCRKAFGDYWEGVEECVKSQKAAKKRLGL
jgi:hypothetical protein